MGSFVLHLVKIIINFIIAWFSFQKLILLTTCTAHLIARSSWWMKMTLWRSTYCNMCTTLVEVNKNLFAYCQGSDKWSEGPSLFQFRHTAQLIFSTHFKINSVTSSNDQG
jgi:hypothetical protein